MKGYVDVAELSREVDSITASDAVDAELAASGDTHAFERLYRNHVGRIHNLARRMVGPDDADEAAQDVFVRAWEKPSFSYILDISHKQREPYVSHGCASVR